MLILGITCRTGLLAAEEALSSGHQVVGIACNLNKFTLKGAEIYTGMPYNFETVQKAIEGCKAVIGFFK